MKRTNWEVISTAIHPGEVNDLIRITCERYDVAPEEAMRMFEDTEWIRDQMDAPDGELFEDAFIAVNSWDERKYISSDYSLRLPRNYTRKDVWMRWEQLEDIFVDSYDCILQQFYGFPPGTANQEIWEAFEEAGLDVYEALYHHRMVFHGGY